MTTIDRPTVPEATELQARVTDLIRERLDIVIDDPATDLFATGIIDSLSFVTLLQALEEAFGITVDLDDLDIATFSTVAGIAGYVEGRWPG